MRTLRQKRRSRHDGNPMLASCLGNVLGKVDRRGNLYPTKQQADQKIDVAVALMMAIGWAISEDADRGLDGFCQIPSLPDEVSADELIGPARSEIGPT